MLECHLALETGVVCRKHAPRTSPGVRDTAALEVGGRLVHLNLVAGAGRGQLGSQVSALGPRRGASLYWERVGPKATELLKDHGEKLRAVGLGNDFLDTTPEVKATKAKLALWEHVKLNFTHQQPSYGTGKSICKSHT